MNTNRKDKLVSVYRCSWCYELKIVEKSNHHPWCSCGSDRFDWSGGLKDVSLEEAEKVVEKDDGSYS